MNDGAEAVGTRSPKRTTMAAGGARSRAAATSRAGLHPRRRYRDRMTVPELPVEAAATEHAVRRCFPVFRELRPHLDPETFLHRWHIQSEQGYQIVYVEDAGTVAAAAGFREMTTMAWGHILYLDDLVTLPACRRKGYGSTLLRYVQAEAVDRGCQQLHLDTGYQRHAAHRSYLRNGFDLVSHHMSWTPSS